MTTALSQEGQIVLPSAVREQLGLQPGDDFEVIVEDDDTITLRRVSSPPNRGLVKHLLNNPGPLELPERGKDPPHERPLDEAQCNSSPQ